MKITLRQANPKDVLSIRSVQRITWLDTYPNQKLGITVLDIFSKFEDDRSPKGKKLMEDRIKSLKDPNKGTWVAQDKKEIVGFCIAVKEESNNRIQAIYVLPSNQRQGIGSKLIKTAFDWFKDTKDILINVASYNHNAINFYTKHGFSKTGKTGNLKNPPTLPSGKIIPEIEMIRVVN